MRIQSFSETRILGIKNASMLFFSLRVELCKWNGDKGAGVVKQKQDWDGTCEGALRLIEFLLRFSFTHINRMSSNHELSKCTPAAMRWLASRQPRVYCTVVCSSHRPWTALSAFRFPFFFFVRQEWQETRDKKDRDRDRDRDRDSGIGMCNRSMLLCSFSLSLFLERSDSY